ncbi:MAG: hypothetical protein R2752_17790 [Vicinamibacterales bacterium]
MRRVVAAPAARVAAHRSGGGTGGARAGGATAGNGPVRHFELLNLATGDKYDAPNVGFPVLEGLAWLAIKMNGSQEGASHRGTDLLLRRLSDGTTQNVGNVAQYDFDDAGKVVAYTVDAADQLGNGVFVLDLASGTTRALDTDRKTYDSLSWRADSTDLVALRGEQPDGKTQRENVLLAWTGAGSANPSPIVWDPSTDNSFPSGFVLSEFSAPRWSEDGSRLFVGIKEQEDKPEESSEPKANLDIYHWKDVDLQSEQIVRIAQLRRATYASALSIPSKTFVRLADDAIDVTTTADAPRSVDPTPYQHDPPEGDPSRADYYRIDTSTGQSDCSSRSTCSARWARRPTAAGSCSSRTCT